MVFVFVVTTGVTAGVRPAVRFLVDALSKGATPSSDFGCDDGMIQRVQVLDRAASPTCARAPWDPVFLPASQASISGKHKRTLGQGILKLRCKANRQRSIVRFLPDMYDLLMTVEDTEDTSFVVSVFQLFSFSNSSASAYFCIQPRRVASKRLHRVRSLHKCRRRAMGGKDRGGHAAGK